MFSPQLKWRASHLPTQAVFFLKMGDSASIRALASWCVLLMACPVCSHFPTLVTPSVGSCGPSSLFSRLAIITSPHKFASSKSGHQLLIKKLPSRGLGDDTAPEEDVLALPYPQLPAKSNAQMDWASFLKKLEDGGVSQGTLVPNKNSLRLILPYTFPFIL